MGEGKLQEIQKSVPLTVDSPISALVVDNRGEDVYLGLSDGQILRIDLRDADAAEPARRRPQRDLVVGLACRRDRLLGKAVEELNRRAERDRSQRYDRLIVLTDEQAHDTVPGSIGNGYVVNVASYKNGVGYGKWTHIDGWSEAVVEYIRELETTLTQ